MIQDLVFGDTIEIGISDNEHIADLLQMRKGDNKFSPISGIDAFYFVKSTKKEALNAEIRRQLVNDNATINQLFVDKEVIIHANYKS